MIPFKVVKQEGAPFGVTLFGADLIAGYVQEAKDAAAAAAPVAQSIAAVEAVAADLTGANAIGQVAASIEDIIAVPLWAMRAEAARDDVVPLRDAVVQITTALPAGYTPRSGVVWAILDAAKRRLRYIDPTGVGWSNIPERFMRRVDFRGGASMAGERLTDLPAPVDGGDAVRYSWVADQLDGKLGRDGGTLTGGLSAGGFRISDLAAPVAPGDPARMADVGHVVRQLPPGYSARSGAVWAVLDRAKRRLRYIDGGGVGWSNIHERFNRPVEFRARAVFSEVERSGSVTRYPLGYDRSGWVVATVDKARRVLFGLRTGGTAWAFGRRLAFADEVASALPAPDYVPAALLPIANMAEAYGDSLMAGSGGGGVNPYTTMATAIGGGFVAAGQAIGGQKITQIAMRLGAMAIKLTVSGDAAPANGGSVAITAINGAALGTQSGAQTPDYRFLSTNASALARSMAGFINGQPATVRRTVVGGAETYELLLTANNPAFSIPAGSVFVPASVATLRDKEIWIDGGINDLYDTGAKERILATYDLIVRFARPVVKRLIIFGLFPGNYPSEKVGGAAWTMIREINDTLRERYPQHFAIDATGRDLHRLLVDGYDPASSTDVADYALDIVPLSLRASATDHRHLNMAGYRRWGAWGAEVRRYLYNR